MMTILLLFLALAVYLQETDSVKCFRRVDPSSGRCEDELGDAGEVDCCQNINHGYQGKDAVCHYCGHRVLTPWQSWSQCSVPCGVGIRHRRRKCLGVPEPDEPDPNDRKSPCHILNSFQSEPCNVTTCCSAVQWGVWSSWSACSVSCGGGGGVKERVRECHSEEAGCFVVPCVGEPKESASCTSDQPCPVHGSWSGWESWSECTHTCIVGYDDGSIVFPTRSRYRLCDNPTPSSDTVPPGNNCPGEDYEVEGCRLLPNCPVNGGWGPWGLPSPCSVSCGEGLQLSNRRCDKPTPTYGGNQCVGVSTKSRVCSTTCPVHGGWTSWSIWSECSTSCIAKGRVPTKTRYRFCTNPAPSFNGTSCLGDNKEMEPCGRLPHCPVDGGWGPWSSYTSCSVTCAVGIRQSSRDCNNPQPEHGGLHCQGAGNRSIICTTNVHCPVDGVWSDWSNWSACKSPTGQKIRCIKTGRGTQSRERECNYQRHGGKTCEGDDMGETQACYDIHDCPLDGTWAGWGQWSPCKPSCGKFPSKRTREKICEPDFSGYRTTFGNSGDKAWFHGVAEADCGDLPEGEEETEEQPCNISACPP